MIGHIQTKFEVGCSTQSSKIDKNLGVFLLFPILQSNAIYTKFATDPELKTQKYTAFWTLKNICDEAFCKNACRQKNSIVDV